jgi:hypothetical protein
MANDGWTAHPYEDLGLPTKASLEEVIARGKALMGACTQGEKVAAWRRALDEICQHPARRACHQFWEPPEAAYDPGMPGPFRPPECPVDVKEMEKARDRLAEACSIDRLIAGAVLLSIDEGGMPSGRDGPGAATPIELEPSEAFR